MESRFEKYFFLHDIQSLFFDRTGTWSKLEIEPSALLRR